jgi:predicted MFS family arabinose efflux permease
MKSQTSQKTGEISAELDKGWQVFAVGLVGFCAFLSLYSTQPLLPLFHRIFNASKLAVSLTVSAPTLAVALAAPFVGMIADLRERKKVIIPVIYMLAFSNLLIASSPGLSSIIFWRFIPGLLTPAVFAVAVAYINEEWETTETGFVTSVYVTGTVLGGFCGRFLSGLVSAHWNWTWVYVLLGLLNLALAAAVSYWLPLAKSFKRVKDYGVGMRNMLGHFRNKSLLAIYAVGFTILFSLVGTFTFITFYLADPPFSLSPALLGAVFAVYLIGAVITPLAGKWSNRLASCVENMSSAPLVHDRGTFNPHSRPVAGDTGLSSGSSGVFVCQIITNRSIRVAGNRGPRQ